MFAVLMTVMVGTTPLELPVGTVVDSTAGTATYDLGGSQLVIRVAVATPRFSGDLDPIAKIDATDRGIDVEHGIIETIDRRVLITPITEAPGLVLAAYVPWQHQATRIELSTNAVGTQRKAWRKMARDLVLATQPTPATSIEHFGPFILALPRRVAIEHRDGSDAVVDGQSHCEIKPLASSISVAPADAYTNPYSQWLATDAVQQAWFMPDGMSVGIEVTVASLDLRMFCFGATKGASLFSVLRGMRRLPRLVVLERIGGLLH